MKACMGGVGGGGRWRRTIIVPICKHHSHLLTTREFFLMMTLIVCAVGFPPSRITVPLNKLCLIVSFEGKFTASIMNNAVALRKMFTLRLVGQKPVPRCELRCFFNSLSPVLLSFPVHSMAWNSVVVIGLMTGTR
jgi:hypothetical protein